MRRRSGFDEAQPGPLGTYSAAAHRASDIVNQAITDGHAGKWVALRLDDGGSDGQVYDRRKECVRHQGANSGRRAYTKVPYDSMPVAEAASWLAYNRMVIEKLGGQLPDPERDQVVLPERRELIPAAANVRRHGLWLPKQV